MGDKAMVAHNPGWFGLRGTWFQRCCSCHVVHVMRTRSHWLGCPGQAVSESVNDHGEARGYVEGGRRTGSQGDGHPGFFALE